MVWLIPTIIGDGRRRGLTGAQIWREVRQGVRNGAIVVDGRALFAHDYAHADDAVDAVLRELAAATT
jgi:nucleoside-diphosphate-sugar epimerase